VSISSQFILFQLISTICLVNGFYISSHSLQPNDFIPMHSCRGHMDDEHVKFVYTFFWVRSTTFLLDVPARDIVKSRGTNLHRYQYLRLGCVFDLSSKSIGRQSDRSLQRRSYSRFNKLRGY